MGSGPADVVCRRSRLALDDAWLEVAEWGSGQAEVSVVLSHGWTLSSRIWEDVATLLVHTDPTLRVIAYDHRGHGNSARVPTASIERLADDLAAVVETLVPTGPIVFGGHSLGGMTLLGLAQRHPELVAQRAAGAAFVATSAGDLLGTLRRITGFQRLLDIALAAAARTAMPSRPLWLLRQGARGAFGKSPHRHDLNRAVLQGALSDPRAVAALGRSILQHNRYDVVADFADLDVVVMAGTRDWLTSPAHARRIVAALPHGRLVVFPGAGHFLPYERADAVTAELLGLTSRARLRVPDWAGAAG